MAHPDILIENGTVLALDDENRVWEKGAVCISGGVVVHAGTDVPEGFSPDKTIDARGGLILPGLINGHTHAAMSLFRGLADDLPLMDWLNAYIFPVERRMDADFVYAGSLLACAEMILSGTTTFCDMYLFEDETAKAAADIGMRCVVGEVLYDFPSPNYGTIDQGMAYTKALIRKWKGHPLVSVAVEPHSLFTCSPALLAEANEIASDEGTPLIMHLAETLDEVHQIKKQYGKGPVEHLLSLGLLSPRLIADHCVHLNQKDLQTLAAHGVKVVHNPESNMKLASGIAPVPEMLRCGITVGLGTDGCASNNNLDLLSEMDAAAKLHKLAAMDATAMDALTVLRMATAEGARALGIDRLTGSIEAGKRADIIVVDTDKPHLTPLYDPYSQLAYAAGGGDVSHSVIDGRVVMEERKLLTVDLDEVMARAKEKARTVKGWVGEKGA